MNNNILKDRIAIVTGGRRGIGRAIAHALARAGANVAVCDSVADDGRLRDVEREINNFGRRSLAVQTDISQKAEVENLIQRVMSIFGSIHILVNCAGIWIPSQTLLECTEDNWDMVMDTNLKGTYFCCQAAGGIMIRQKIGNIINLSSQVGITPGTGTGAYSISKAGIIMLTRQLALELGQYNIRVNALAPGVIKTDFNAMIWKNPEDEKKIVSTIPLGRLADPEDVAAAAVFLASDDSRYITGDVLTVNGGWHPGGA